MIGIFQGWVSCQEAGTHVTSTRVKIYKKLDLPRGWHLYGGMILLTELTKGKKGDNDYEKKMKITLLSGTLIAISISGHSVQITEIGDAGRDWRLRYYSRTVKLLLSLGKKPRVYTLQK